MYGILGIHRQDYCVLLVAVSRLNERQAYCAANKKKKNTHTHIYTYMAMYINAYNFVIRISVTKKRRCTLSGGSLGSWIDEERS